MVASRVERILAGVVGAGADEGTLPQRLCAACALALPVSGVGLALMTDVGHGGTITATDGTATLMEELQLSLGEGPCVDASRERRAVMLPELAVSGVGRYPVFGPAVLAAGVAAIFAFPLQVGAIRLGILDLYRTSGGGLSDGQLAEALAFADAAVVILLHLQDQSPGGPDALELHSAVSDPLAAGREIHQATGMISVQAGVGLTEAMLLLRAHAFAGDRALLPAAQDVVAHRVRFPADPVDGGSDVDPGDGGG